MKGPVVDDLFAETESAATIRLKRIRLRSWRRGMREMDLVLGAFADATLQELDDAALDDYEAMLEQNDQELYRWVSGQETPAAPFQAMIARIRKFHNLA